MSLNRNLKSKLIAITCLASLVLAFSACNKDNEDEKNTDAKKEFDQSNYGIYKGVFVGSNQR